MATWAAEVPSTTSAGPIQTALVAPRQATLSAVQEHRTRPSAETSQARAGANRLRESQVMQGVPASITTTTKEPPAELGIGLGMGLEVHMVLVQPTPGARRALVARATPHAPVRIGTTLIIITILENWFGTTWLGVSPG
jgi:hypothetical protein